MALYRWDTKVAGVAKSFNPGNVGTTWQVLTRTATWYDWEESTWWIVSSNDTYDNIIYLSQSEYDNLSSYEPNTLYSTPDNWGSSGIIWEVICFAWTVVPTNFLECDWSSLSTTTYAKLFSVIGYTYWWADTSFSLPNLKGRVIAWYDSAQTDFNTIGKSGWEATHLLTTDEIPAHTHTIPNWSWYWSSSGKWGSNYNSWTLSTSSVWWWLAHNNLQPYQVVAYWKRTA